MYREINELIAVDSCQLTGKTCRIIRSVYRVSTHLFPDEHVFMLTRDCQWSKKFTFIEIDSRIYRGIHDVEPLESREMKKAAIVSLELMMRPCVL